MHLESITRNLCVGGTATALLLAMVSAAPAQTTASVTGVVNDASGQPVTGAFVKLKNDQKRLTFMVVSRAQGRFEAKDLPPGSYRVQGVGGDRQSKWSPEVAVAAGGEGAKVTLALTDARGPALAPAWPHRVPEAQAEKASKDPKDLPEGEGKQLVADFCNSCHDLQRTVANRSDPDHWGHTVKRMRTRMIVASMPDLTEQQYQTIVKYLSEKFGPLQPYDANSRLPRTLASGKALNYRAVQYELADTHAEPHDVAVDPSGNAWVGERAGKLGRLDRQTLEFTEIPTPAGQAAPDRQSLGNPQIDSKGVLWVHDGPNQRWLSYDTNAGKFEVYPFPKGKGNAGGNSITIHPDGSVWATGGGGQARRLDPKTKEFQFFDAPSLKTRKEAPGAYGMAVAGDGSVWFAQDQSDLMARVDPASGKVEEFKIPYDGFAYPRRMNVDGNGDLWVGLWNGGKLMKVDHKTKQMTIYAPPTPISGAYSVVVDKKNNLVWVSLQQVDKIARFDPKTEEWMEFPLPEAESDPRRIEIDPTNPNRIYFAGNIPGRVGFVEVLQE
jgi:streptogramin lyase/mono/diheme cytochrome c family protein